MKEALLLSFFYYFCKIMRNKTYLYVIIVIVIGILSFIFYYSQNPCYKPAERQGELFVPHHHDDTIRIAYIGDSWAYKHKEMSCVIDSLISLHLGRPVMVRSTGVGGLVSKEIYYSLFYNHEFRNILEWGPDFCYVSVGINDTNKKIGSSNYKENMRLLISTLLENDIVPIIQDIPYYDIVYSFTQMNAISMFRSLRSMLWTWSSLNCIDEYSDSLYNLIEEKHWQDNVILLKRDSWNPQGYYGQSELYTKDRMHINQEGYFLLDSCIASCVVKYLCDYN